MKVYGCLNSIMHFRLYLAENMFSLHYKGQPINNVKANKPNHKKHINTFWGRFAFV